MDETENQKNKWRKQITKEYNSMMCARGYHKKRSRVLLPDFNYNQTP